jgi:hypothetical protein
MMFWNWQHLDSCHDRRRNSQEDFVVWVFLSPKWLSLLSCMHSVMRFGGGQVFQKTNVSTLSRMTYWTSLRWCDSYVSYSPCILLFWSRLLVTWQLSSRVEFEYHESLCLNSTHHKNCLYSTQGLELSPPRLFFFHHVLWGDLVGLRFDLEWKAACPNRNWSWLWCVSWAPEAAKSCLPIFQKHNTHCGSHVWRPTEVLCYQWQTWTR